MAQYNDTAALRAALTDDDPDDRAEAYGAVMGQDVQPSELLQTPPKPAALETLRAAGVLGDAASDGAPIGDRWERIEELLEAIRDNTAGSSSGGS